MKVVEIGNVMIILPSDINRTIDGVEQTWALSRVGDDRAMRRMPSGIPKNN